jgi:hypothetical protein
MSMDNKSTCGTCGYQWMTGQDGRHSCVPRLEASNAALREELVALKADKQILSKGIDARVANSNELRKCLQYFVTRVEAGTIRSKATYDMFKKTLSKTPAQSLAKIRADAILSVLDTPYDCETPNGDIAWSSESLRLISSFHLHANKIEAGS